MAATSSSPSSLTLRARDEIGIVSVGAVIIVVVVVVLARAFAPSPSPRRVDAGKRARGARDTESVGSTRGNAGVERPPSPLATTRRGGEEEENIRAARSTPRVALSLVASRARATRPTIHPSRARSRGRSFRMSVRFITVAAVSYLRRARGCRALLPRARVVFSDGWDTFERYTYTKPSPGGHRHGVDTSPRHRGDSRRVVIQEN